MRQTTVYLLTWLAATVVATGVGFAATTTVGDVLRGSGPVGAEFRTAPSAGDEQAPARIETFVVERVRMAVECTGRPARLLEVAVPPELVVTDTDEGPDEDVHVRVSDGTSTELRIEVYCSADGRPRPVVERRLTTAPAN
ncbi:MAG: hypothetical protein ACT4RN_03545 [Pseudonocardia sp.]